MSATDLKWVPLSGRSGECQAFEALVFAIAGN